MGSLVAEIAERVASSSSGARSELEIRGGLALPGTLLLSTAETTVVDGNKLGQIDFQAPVDTAGTDAILVAASIYAEADNTFSSSVNATELVFATGASEAAAEKMRLTSDGKVGIGTSVPVTDLTIDGTITLKEQADADADTAAYGQIWVNTATPCQLYFTTDAGNDVQITDGSALAGAFDTDAAQVFNESGADVDFRIESDDQVNMFVVNGGDDRIGIGTTTGDANMMNIEKAASNTEVMIKTYSDTLTHFPNLILMKSDSDTLGTNAQTDVGDVLGQIEFAGRDTGGSWENGGKIKVTQHKAASGSALPSRMDFYIGNGNAANPSYGMLSLRGGDGATHHDYVYIGGGAGGNESLLLRTGSTIPGAVEISASEGGNEGLVIAHSRNSTSVDQNCITFTKQEASDAVIGIIDGSVTQVAYRTTSDYRLKENIVDITGAVDRIKTLPARTFSWKDDEDSVMVEGFIAHELQVVAPEAVSGTKDAVHSNGKIKPQGVDYGRITPLIVAALKEAIERIEVLEAE